MLRKEKKKLEYRDFLSEYHFVYIFTLFYKAEIQSEERTCAPSDDESIIHEQLACVLDLRNKSTLLSKLKGSFSHFIRDMYIYLCVPILIHIGKYKVLKH